MRWGTLICAVLLGCKSEAPPAPLVVPTAEPARDPLSPPVEFVTDLAKSEDAALKVAKDLGKRVVCGAWRSQHKAGFSEALSEGFLGTGFGAPGPAQTPSPGLTHQILSASTDPLDRAAFVGQWWGLVADLAVVERCRFKPFEFRLRTDGSAWARLHVEVGGRLRDGRYSMRRADWTVALEHGAAWRLTAARTGPVEVVTGARTFASVGQAVGVGLHLRRAERERTAELVDRSVRTNIGTLGALDWNRDGFEDLLVSVQGHSLRVFVNDGAGGFDPTPSLIPAAEVGSALLWLDLDRDGVEELISAEVVACSEGRAELGVYRRVGDTLERRPGALAFAAPCAEARPQGRVGYAFQTLVPGDIDGDGDLDLFAGAYAGPGSLGRNFNYFQAEDGAPNRLFLNTPAGFQEVAAERGLREHHYTYVAAWLDLDQDGDLDLFAGNDYGADDVYLNDGNGHFNRDPRHPVAGPAWSMGAAVVDLDGDGALDLSVSRMYSTAGNRVVPLVRGRLSAAIQRQVLVAAAGNAVFSSGRGWADRAAELGLDRANWAWGQAPVDLDNDGDPDQVVVNGMTSHRNYKEHDY